ncbi:CopG family transcriptional regulator [Roseibium aestuarii]|uniref:Ribbon-helix-helix CopG family protein n=1 Tax=Roseibium aestuarii TaxID=2600299 RepID=A0ABW4JZP4_9HYPH|nr:CopG family transcriptional regulator [Roseibium aestuarii]
MASAPKGTVRLTANLPEDVANTLRELAQRKGINMTDVLTRAINLEKFAADTIDNGGKILVEEKDKTFKQVILR